MNRQKINIVALQEIPHKQRGIIFPPTDIEHQTYNNTVSF